MDIGLSDFLLRARPQKPQKQLLSCQSGRKLGDRDFFAATNPSDRISLDADFRFLVNVGRASSSMTASRLQRSATETVAI